MQEESSHFERDILVQMAHRSKEILEQEIGVSVSNDNIEVEAPKRVELKKNTAMIGTGGSIQVIITMGYDDSLLDKIVEGFLEGEEVGEDELEEVRESVSCEMINIIVGNALKNPVDSSTLSITPPIVIYEAKSFSKHKSSNVATSTIQTEFGDMLVTVVGPRKTIVKELKLKGL